MMDGMGHLSSGGLVWAIPCVPLISFVVIMLFGGRILQVLGDAAGRRVIGALATLAVLVPFALSAALVRDLLALPAEARRAIVPLLPFAKTLPWIDAGPIHAQFAALIDPLSALMCLIVTGVGGLIHLYATGYMAHDRDYARFFAYFNLFIVAMLFLVLGESILMMFVGWEGVGLCSYLLISFWYDDTDNAKAGNKAFIVNRIGDVGFVLGILTIVSLFGTVSFHTADGRGFLDLAARKETLHGALGIGSAALIAGLLFIGACGKSAQFPLHIWLPDAMAGPTPVSALIHAATMVTAGVVMLTRMSVIFVQAPAVLLIVALVGLFTAIFAATIALTQTDIKKVLAYSTVSQLGFMFLGCGAGAFAAGMFHVMTHAFFKALLFLGAGSVIHGMAGQQNMRLMGGLRKHMPITFATMVAAWAAICGFPGLSGYWSKDLILGYGAGIHTYGMVIYAVGTFTAFLTGLYMTRLMVMTFGAKERFNTHEVHVHESPPSMWIPLALLAVLSIIGGLIGTPWGHQLQHFLEPVLPTAALHVAHEGVPVGVGLGIGAIVAIAAMAAGLVFYPAEAAKGEAIEPARNPILVGAGRLWYVDSAANAIGIRFGGKVATVLWQWVDQGIIDRLVNIVAFVVGLLSEIVRGLQTGYVRIYVTTMLAGVAVLAVWALIGGGAR